MNFALLYSAKKMWALQKTKSGNAHVVENVHDIISGAAAQFDAGQFEHLTVLIKDTWQVSQWELMSGPTGFYTENLRFLLYSPQISFDFR